MMLLMNFERPTTCQYYMPYVVAYVVLVRVLMSADMPYCTRWSAMGPGCVKTKSDLVPARGNPFPCDPDRDTLPA
jgi:hypothetical protein